MVATGYFVLRARSPSAAVSPDAGTPSVATYPSYAHAPGAEAAYKLTFSSDTTLDVSAATDRAPVEGSAQRILARIEGRLVSTVIDDDADKSLLFLRMEGPSAAITANGAVASTDEANVARALEMGFLAQRARSGKILALQVPESTAVARSSLRAIAVWLQVTLGERGAREWKVAEKDRRGDIFVAYTAVADAQVGPGLFAIRKVSQRPGDELAGGVRGGGVSTVVEVDFDLGAGLPRTLAGEERAAHGERAIATGTAKFNIELIQAKTLGKAELDALALRVAALRTLPFTPLDQPEQSVTERANIEAQRLAGATLKELLDGLKDDKKVRDAKFFFQLRAFAILRPEEVDKLAEPLRTADPKNAFVEVLVGALAGAGTPAAQHAIVEAIRARKGNERAETLYVTILGTTAHPTPEAVDTVFERRETSTNADVINASALALGFMASSLATEAPETVNRIVDNELGHIRREEGDLPKLRSAIAGLGNAASVRAMSELLRLSRSPVEEVRARSTWALRGVGHADAERRVIDVLTVDESRLARHEAVQALRYRPQNEAIYDVLRQRVASDSVPGVRIELLRLLWQKYPSDEVLALLAERAVQDPDELVRKAAFDLIEASSIDRAGKKDASPGNKSP